MKKILIVGGVAGGASAAARLRRLDEKAQIIMFEMGQYISFANCGLPYYTYRETYDKLILSPGAKPVVPPIPGIDNDRIFTLQNIPDTDAIYDFVTTNNPQKAVVVGAGYIGLEMAENLAHRGISVAMTGVTEQALKAANIDFEKLYIHPGSHAWYYPGAEDLHIKLLFTRPKGKILSAQIVGAAGVDKRIDVFATAIRAGMTVFDLQEFELAYAPPYGNAKDPVNIAGYAAANILDGTVDIKHLDQLSDDDFILDVRTAREVAAGTLPRAVHIYVDELRDRLEELPTDKTICAYCAEGLRSYIACRILTQKGFNAKSVPGGIVTYRTLSGESK